MDHQYTFDEDPELVKLTSAWNKALARTQPSVTNQRYTQFLAPLKPRSIKDGVVVVGAPGSFVAKWVKVNCEDALQKALSDELGETVNLQFVAEENPLQSAAQVRVGASAAPASTAKTSFNGKYTFDNYIVGPTNRLAHAGAFAVAEEPAKRFNPLFIYGGSGLGKTHLLHAIGNVLTSAEEPANVQYITSQEFAEQFVSALQYGRMEQFRRKIRAADVWLLDDVQFIAGRDRTQEELFHLFNQLQMMGKQLVFTSDRPPRDLSAMDDRLRTRFESGLVADIMPPDVETKTAILSMKAKAENADLPYEICEYLAATVPGNIRTLEGALTKLLTQASLENQPVTLEFTKKVVEASYPPSTSHRPHFDKIVDETCSHFGLARRDLLGPSRRADLARARHICVYICRNLTGDSWKRLGERFGNRDHTSMIHAYQRVSELANRDLDTQGDLRNIERRLQLGS